MNNQFLEGYKGLTMQRTLDEDFKKLLIKPVVSYLKEKKVGEYEIRIETILPGDLVTVVSARNWLLMGYKEYSVSFAEPRPIYKLFRENQLLMSDCPQEMFLQYEPYKEAKGKVLMGGLGIGMTPTLVAEKDNISEVVVVEISKDVIKLCKPKNKKIRVVNDDIWHFLETTTEKFDYIYIDIHYSTGCMEYIKTVLPMRKILEKKFPGVSASFWAEEEMKSQYDPEFDSKWVEK